MEENYIYHWEFENKKDRSSLWYIIAFSIVIGLVIWGFFTKQYGMSFVILLISGIAYFLENNSDDFIHVYITQNGLNIGNVFYDYQAIDSYSCIYNGKEAIFLRLFLNKKGIKILDLNINNEIVNEIKETLGNYIKENESSQLNFSEKLIGKLKL